MSTKSHPLQIRLDEKLRESLQKAADKRGLKLSTWIKMVCKEEAERATSGGVRHV